ncbi:TetR/AcrR family transcriptional regulator [Amycolatopsis sp. NPDC059021]|uniref:TetR/AcrR family transcriptional regulator n=1 Tax=Amycolatopsis sp. NPDC059021 TaxID=3346704 RepID=UPI00366A6F6A
MSTRKPTGAAVLQPEVTQAITEAVLDELAEQGFGRLSMEAVAKRAGVGKSALYRRWPSKHDMISAVVSEFSVTRAEVEDTGSLRGDLMLTLKALQEWITHPRFSRILPDLVAEGARHPGQAEVMRTSIAIPRRERGEDMLRRAIARGELPEDTDLEMALDLLAAPMYWRLVVRQAPPGPDYLDRLADLMLRALGAKV